MKDDHSKHPPEKRETYTCRGRLWLEGTEGTFLGYGRIVLLERIDQFGTIAQAARSMEMSYKHAWDLVDSMNRQATAPLVSKTSGGKRGGGTKLTERGLEAIAAYRAMDERFRNFLTDETGRFMAEFERNDKP